MKKYPLIFLLNITLGLNAYAQLVFEPSPSSVYEFLNRLAVSPRLNITSFGIDAGYEIYRELKAHLYYQYSNVTDDEKGRTLEFKLGSNHIFGISLGYGL